MGITGVYLMQYKKVLIKLSGEALYDKKNNSVFSNEILEFLADEIKELSDMGLKIGLVFGGGNIFRGESGQKLGIDRISGDHIGMLSTIINSLMFKSLILKKGVSAELYTSLRIPAISSVNNLEEMNKKLENNSVILFSGGTGKPFFTTDTAGSLFASAIKADLLIKATKVNGIYDKDPVKNSDAKLYDKITYDEAIEKNLKFMDISALSMCRDNKIKIVVCNLFEKNNLKKIVLGDKIGSLIY